MASGLPTRFLLPIPEDQASSLSSVTSALESGSPGIVGVFERVGGLALLWGGKPPAK